MRTSPATLENAKGWKIEFDKPLVNGQAVTVEVDVFLGSALEMYPAEIEQKEKQLVSFTSRNYLSMRPGFLAFDAFYDLM